MSITDRLELDELYDKARRVDKLEAENKQLRGILATTQTEAERLGRMVETAVKLAKEMLNENR